jgi:hypothetical protein
MQRFTAAVAVGLAVALAGSATGQPVSNESQVQRPIRLLCPAENGSVLEIVRMNMMGQASRLTVVYHFDQATRITIETADLGGRLRRKSTDLPSSMPDDDLDYLISEVASINRDVCGVTPEARAHAETAMAANREALRAILGPRYRSPESFSP